MTCCRTVQLIMQVPISQISSILAASGDGENSEREGQEVEDNLIMSNEEQKLWSAVWNLLFDTLQPNTVGQVGSLHWSTPH